MSYLDAIVAQEEEYERLHEEEHLDAARESRRREREVPYDGSEPERPAEDPETRGLREAQERDAKITRSKPRPPKVVINEPEAAFRVADIAPSGWAIADSLDVPKLSELDEDQGPRPDLERQLAELEKANPGVIERSRALRRAEVARGTVRPMGVEL